MGPCTNALRARGEGIALCGRARGAASDDGGCGGGITNWKRPVSIVSMAPSGGGGTRRAEVGRFSLLGEGATLMMVVGFIGRARNTREVVDRFRGRSTKRSPWTFIDATRCGGLMTKSV